MALVGIYSQSYDRWSLAFQIHCHIAFRQQFVPARHQLPWCSEREGPPVGGEGGGGGVGGGGGGRGGEGGGVSGGVEAEGVRG